MQLHSFSRLSHFQENTIITYDWLILQTNYLSPYDMRNNAFNDCLVNEKKVIIELVYWSYSK